MDELYYNKSNADETIESVLKKLIRVNDDGELYVAINFLSNTEIIFDELSQHPNPHETKGILYSMSGGVLYYRKSIAEGGSFAEIGGTTMSLNVSRYVAFEGQAEIHLSYPICLSNILILFNGSPINTSTLSLTNIYKLVFNQEFLVNDEIIILSGNGINVTQFLAIEGQTEKEIPYDLSDSFIVFKNGGTLPINSVTGIGTQTVTFLESLNQGDLITILSVKNGVTINRVTAQENQVEFPITSVLNQNNLILSQGSPIPNNFYSGIGTNVPKLNVPPLANSEIIIIT